MQILDLKKYKNIFFIGIGGISMSSLAEILLNSGFYISGSDISASKITNELEKKGVRVYIGHNKNNITDDINLVVHTAAIKEDNEELTEARNKKITVIDRATLLGLIMKHYKKAVAVSGSHGKTTTSSMLAEILINADVSPTITVGGIINKISSNTLVGDSDYFVAEACEYCDSFLKFNHFVGIILNIDMDHSDYFKDINHLRKSFHSFANLIPKNGALIINNSVDNIDNFVKDLKCNVITYGISNNQKTKTVWTASDIHYNKNGCADFKIMYASDEIGKISLNVIGEVNVLNALASAACAHYLGIDIKYIVGGLNNFKGTQRRFEYKGTVGEFKIYDDYAHHPTEIQATLKAASYFDYNKMWCVFQPHTYTRTKAFFKDFVHSFGCADKIIITDIYAAREPDPGDISSKDLVLAMNKIGIDAVYIKSFSDVEDYLIHNLTNDDMLITMGAGNIHLIGENILENYTANN